MSYIPPLPGEIAIGVPPSGSVRLVAVVFSVAISNEHLVVIALRTKTYDVVPPLSIIARTPPRTTSNELNGTAKESLGDSAVVAENKVILSLPENQDTASLP